jgi:membrane protease YdiL (CAAX protease family)
MSDVVFWALVVVVVLAAQASEPRVGAAADGATGGGRSAEPVLGPGATTIARVAVAAAAVLMVIIGLLTLAGANAPGSSGADRNRALAGGALQLAAGLACVALFYFGTSRVPGFRRLRPGAPISWLAIVLFFESLAINLAPASGQATVTTTVQPSTQPSAENLMLGAVPFLVIGVVSVGPFVRRTARQAAERLGLWPLRVVPWWVLGIGAGLLLIPVGNWVAGLLSNLTSVQCLAQQLQVQHAIAGTARTTLEQIGVAASAGVCEETLFRGALQPRVGILLSSTLWASYHLQYTCNGLPSASNLYILLLGFAFGALRKAGGLWPAILAHTVYDGVILLGWF